MAHKDNNSERAAFRIRKLLWPNRLLRRKASRKSIPVGVFGSSDGSFTARKHHGTEHPYYKLTLRHL